MDIKTISGIDTLYFFYQTNKRYNKLFEETEKQLSHQKEKLENLDIEFSHNDICITLNDTLFIYNGKAQGFHFFTHTNNYFKVGLKQSDTNQTLHNIQIQLLAEGIYTIGLKSLLEYIESFFADVVTGYKPVTRVDINMFVQSDLSFLNKDMFVSRKRNYITHSKEVASKYKMQTLYIGRKPFLLRIYDKKEELKQSHKQEMMYNYFLAHGFNLENDIYNVEFEMHRKYLKSYGLDSVEDVLSVTQKLWQANMDTIRLIDTSSISQKSLYSKNRYKAQRHPLWEYLKKCYTLKDFLSTSKPLVKQKRKQYFYTVEEAIQEHIKLANKAQMHQVVVDKQFYQEVLETLKRGYDANRV